MTSNSQVIPLLNNIPTEFLTLIIIILFVFCSGSLTVIWHFANKIFESFQKTLEKLAQAIEKLDARLDEHRKEIEIRLEKGMGEFRELDVRVTRQEATCAAHQEERREGGDRRHLINE
jgi:Sec-independent protein translocase protein TatA